MNDGAIAIVGASCRFPGAAGLDAFWRLLIVGVDAVSEIGPDRWSTQFFYHPTHGEPGKTYSWAAGLIDGIDQFEPGFFGISPREAAEMDPQQRLLLELTWHALEDAGIPVARLAGTATGVYIGASSTDYGDLRLGDPASGDPYFVAGSTLSILANRISHVFDLHGPSQVIDTACSSSLVALHDACEALRGGRIDVALVGGVNLLLSPYPFIGFAQAGMLSRRGRCFAFDARADGYVRGEGGAVVVLKRRERASADGDPIRAVICGTAVSASGRTMGLSLPSEAAQAELLREIYRNAGIAPDALAFIEMHGTGTPAGDPLEAAAVGRVLGQARTEKLPIGSVKTNIGHLEPASGIAGLLKAMLALEHGVLPRSLYGETPNPSIPFGRLNLRLARHAKPIGSGGYAGVNSFGFGGSNAHAILAAAPRRETQAGGAAPPLMISARCEASLRALAREWRDRLAATPAEGAPQLLRAAARRRDHHPHRLVLVDDRLAALDDFIAGRTSPAAIPGTAAPDGKLAFVYSGNGTQFGGMGEAAYRESAAFRDAIARADEALAPMLGWSVGNRIRGCVTADKLQRADIAQPILFAIEVAITTVLRGAGVTPTGFIGHSVGEIAAAWAAGALSLGDAARIVVVRSRHQERTRGSGRMAVLALAEPETRAILGELALGLEIAAINSKRSVTIAGGAAAIADLGAEATRRGIPWRALDLDFAFHSATMEPIRDDLLADLSGISSTEPVGDLVSTVTARRVTGGALDAMHWWRNIRDPVCFAGAVDVLVADGYRIFAEIGPNPVLLSHLHDALRAEPSGRVVGSLDRRDGSSDPFPAIAARLHVAGHDISDAACFDGPSDPRGLPLYQWQRERFRFGRTVEAVDQVNPILDHRLLGFRQSETPMSWMNHLDTVLFPFLADHCVDGTAVLPAAAIIDMALAAALTRDPNAGALELRDVELLRLMAFDGAVTRELRSTLLPDGDWQIASRKRLVDEPMTVHATGRIAAARRDRLVPEMGGMGEGRVIRGAELYRSASRFGLDYGESFRTVREVMVIGKDRAVVTLPAAPAEGFLIAPALLDGAFQGLLALLNCDEAGAAGFLPRSFGRIRAVAPFGRALRRAELHVTRRGARSAMADIALYDDAGNLVAELADCGFARVDFSRPSVEHCLRAELVPAPLAPMPSSSIFDRLPEILLRIAATQARDPAREGEQALLFEALLAAIAGEALRETDGGTRVPEPLLGLLRQFGEDELPDSGELWRSLLADYPDMAHELAVAAMLREGTDTFDEASPLVAALRQASPPAAAGRAVIASVLDEIAAQWPRDRPLRVREMGGTHSCDRLRRSDVSVLRAGEGEPSDLLVCAEIGSFEAAHASLASGGVLIALMPSPHPFCELFFRRAGDWRSELQAAGLVNIGMASVAHGPWPCEVIWARAPIASAEASGDAALSLAVITDGADAGFIDGLEAAGHRVMLDETPGDAVVLVVGGESDPIEEMSRLLPRFARIAGLAAEHQAPLWLVTVAAQQSGDERGETGGALWGFARVLRNETAGLVLRCLDLPSAMTWRERAEHLARELAAPSAETEIVWTPRGRHVPRLRAGLPTVWAGPDDSVAAVSNRPGQLDHLGWAPAARRCPGPSEIEIEVRAAGVNFRDVMVATGVLPEEALLDGFAGAALGLECAGVVSAVGEGVETIAVGDRVTGFAPRAIASWVVTRADAVIAIPAGVSFAAAATLPVAFVTARYSLITLARLTSGETVLIHAASGGVGLAAIQVAKARGATVIATAGSPAKRAFLRQVGADHVCDSRELRFVADVREATGGAGVDVVLNALHGEAMEASLEMLKPFGRFVELGKRDFAENRRLRARPLRRNISYFAVDVDQLPVYRPDLAKVLLGEVGSALAAGEIRPLAHRAFAFAEIADCFRLMQASRHIGKLVLAPDGNAGVAMLRRPRMSLRRDGIYVVTGGLSGFGFVTARWIAERGAGHLALIGRRGRETPGATERIAELEALGTAVSVHAADVGDADALGAALDAIRVAGTPIRGVVHAATAIVDGMATGLSSAHVRDGLRAKLGGALLLDRLTRDDPLELFWLFSSATTIIGAPGQGAYVAANAGLEALARRRHAEGRPALAIAWGPIADTGALAERESDREALARRLGGRPMTAQRALSALPEIVASGLPVVAFAELGGEAHHSLPMLGVPFFDEVRETVTVPTSDEALLERLAGLSGGERRDQLMTIVREEAARTLRLPASDIDAHRPLAEIGMDSLMALELRLGLEARLRLDLPLMSLSDGASVAAIAARLEGLLAEPPRAAPAAALAARYEVPSDPFDLAAGS